MAKAMGNYVTLLLIPLCCIIYGLCIKAYSSGHQIMIIISKDNITLVSKTASGDLHSPLDGMSIAFICTTRVIFLAIPSSRCSPVAEQEIQLHSACYSLVVGRLDLGDVRTPGGFLVMLALSENYHQNSMVVSSLLTVLTWLDSATRSVVEFVFVVIGGPRVQTFQLVN